MIQVKVEVVEMDKVMAALTRFEGDVLDKIEAFLKREGAQLESDIKISLSHGGNMGRTGPRGGKVQVHSEPGEPPYTQTGNLRAAISHEVTVDRDNGEFWLDVGALQGGSEVDYAGDLELGTSKMLPRPFLVPAALERISQWPEGFRVEVVEKEGA